MVTLPGLYVLCTHISSLGAAHANTKSELLDRITLFSDLDVSLIEP